ncbi:MAG: hypothetical protein HQK83_12685 [Fibrobacteria bacterium]|nr:hypothetical protein [Fibrobacteria bacterium]
MKKKLLIVGCCFAYFLISCNQPRSDSWTSSQYRAAATALYQRELFVSAADMYDKYLHSEVITSADIPKVLYQMGNIYADNVGNHKKALGYYTVLKALYPNETFNNQLGKKIIACLERSGRNIDAKQALVSMTEINPDSKKQVDGSRVVAEIEDRKITLNEIEQAVGKLPEALLEQNQLVSQYVSQILIADAARRKGLAESPAVLKKIQFVQNQILAQENLKEELISPQPTEKDLKYYFEANKLRYQSDTSAGAPSPDFKKVVQKVAKDWQMEKQNEKYQAYVKKLLSSDKVRIYGVSGGAQ